MSIGYLRAYVARAAEDAGDDEPIRFVASTEGVKRDGLDLKAADWDVTNYLRHPVVLWAHDYTGRTLPIGTGSPSFEGAALMIDVTFDRDDPFAVQVRGKARKGMIAGSVGWNARKDGRNELMEFSMVPVPADPDALPVRQAAAMRAYADMLEHWRDGGGKRPEDYPWDECIADQMEQYGDMETAEKVCGAIKEKYGAGHKPTADELRDIEEQLGVKPRERPERGTSEGDVWDGLACAMHALYDPRAPIEDATRQRLHNLYERAYRALGRVPPEYMAAGDLVALCQRDIRGLFLEHEPEVAQVRYGAVLNARNRADLEQAMTLIQGVLDRAKKEEQAPEEPAAGGGEADERALADALAGLWAATLTRAI